MKVRHDFRVEELERALAGAEVGVFSWDIATGQVRWSEQMERIFGLPPGSFAGTFDAYLSHVVPEDVPVVRKAVERAVDLKERAFRLFHRAVRPDGFVFWIEARGTVLLDAAEAVTGMLGTAVECTESKRNEERIRKNEELYRLLTELLTDWVYRADLTKPSMLPEIVVGSFERNDRCAGGDRSGRPDGSASSTPTTTNSFEALIPELSVVAPRSRYRIRDKHGEIRWLRDRATDSRPQDSRAHRPLWGVRDITEQRRLEEQLLHAQKMDALALLAGSVAHDFNNLLLVMGLTLDAISERARRGLGFEPRDVADAQSAVRRATELTQSLLAFGRQQPAQEQAVDLGLVVEGSLPILTRAVPKVRVTVSKPDEVVRVRTDPTRLQLVLLNLVLNAQDANRTVERCDSSWLQS
jgi:PAS domain S-box-containing protein